MTRDEINSKVIEIIVQRMALDAAPFAHDRLELEIGADAMDLADLFMAFEEAFAVAIPDEEMKNLHTVEDVQDFIEDLLLEDA